MRVDDADKLVQKLIAKGLIPQDTTRPPSREEILAFEEAFANDPELRGSRFWTEEERAELRTKMFAKIKELEEKRQRATESREAS